MKKLILIIVIFGLLVGQGWATTYYVIDLPATGCADNNVASATVDGTDYNPTDEDCDGGGSSSYFSTIADINAAAATLEPGDTISFNKGGIWREQLTVPESGTEGNPYTFTSHGTGDDPVISGADIAADSWADAETDVILGVNKILDPVMHVTIGNTSGWRDSSLNTWTISAGTAVSDGTTAWAQLYQLIDGDVNSETYRITYDVKASTVANINLSSTGMFGSTTISGTVADAKTADKAVTNATLAFKIGINTGESVEIDNLYLQKVITVGANVWKQNVATEVTSLRFTASQKGTRDHELDSTYDWHWDGGVLYVYSVGDPFSTYSNLEYSVRDYGINGAAYDYITIDGLTIQNVNLHGITTSGEADAWTVQNSTIDDVGQIGIAVIGPSGSADQSDDWLIANNTIGRVNFPQTAASTKAGLYMLGTKDAVVRNNTISTENVYGIKFNYGGAAGGASEDPLVYENDLDNTFAGMIFSNTTGAKVYKNYIHDGYGFFIGIQEGSNSAQIYNNILANHAVMLSNYLSNGIDVNGVSINGVIYNNIVYGSTLHSLYVGATGGASDGWTVKNNIFHAYNNAGDSHNVPAYVANGTNTITFSNNIYYPMTGTSIAGNWLGVEKNLTDWNTATSDTGSLDDDPLMTDPASDDFTLQSGSPAIDAGALLSIHVDGWTDYAGKTRLYGAGVDMGAYEFVENIGTLFPTPWTFPWGSVPVILPWYVAP